MENLSFLKEFLSANVLDFFANTSWGTIAIVWVVSQVINVETVAKGIVAFVQKIPIQWLRKPLLIFLDRLSRAIDKEIPDEDKPTK